LHRQENYADGGLDQFIVFVEIFKQRIFRKYLDIIFKIAYIRRTAAKFFSGKITTDN